MDSSMTLWQFLRQLLDQRKEDLICWTSNQGEFKLLQAEEVAKLWGLQKNKRNMNYDKLSRALRYYYEKNIIKKVSGQKFVYKFVSAPDNITQEPTTSEGANLKEDEASCERKSFQPSARMSSRNEYMRSGLYTSFTLQSLGNSSILWPMGLQKPEQNQETAKCLPEYKIQKKPENSRTICSVSMNAENYLKKQEGDTREKGMKKAYIDERGHMREREYRKEKRPIEERGSTEEIGCREKQCAEDRRCREERGYREEWGFRKKRECTQELRCREEEKECTGELGQREETIYTGGHRASDMEKTKVAHPNQENMRDGQPPKSKKPKDLALQASCVSAEEVLLQTAAADEVLDPKMTPTPFTLLTQHFQNPLILTPGAFPSAIHFWSTLSPIAPGSPAKLSFQFPSSVSAQIHIPITNLDELSTPVLQSPGLQKL